MSERGQTLKHIERVRELLGFVIDNLEARADIHDRSKLESPEVEVFDEYTPQLRGLTYGSPEYFDILMQMGPALWHHYQYNRHHPEHYGTFECENCGESWPIYEPSLTCRNCNGSDIKLVPNIGGMDLLDVIEMFVDWTAASERHANGDIRKSCEQNQKRYNYDNVLKQIFLNTAMTLDNYRTPIVTQIPNQKESESGTL